MFTKFGIIAQTFHTGSGNDFDLVYHLSGKEEIYAFANLMREFVRVKKYDDCKVKVLDEVDGYIYERLIFTSDVNDGNFTVVFHADKSSLDIFFKRFGELPVK